eukprot:721916-Amphidinium_carterae.1
MERAPTLISVLTPQGKGTMPHNPSFGAPESAKFAGTLRDLPERTGQEVRVRRVAHSGKPALHLISEPLPVTIALSPDSLEPAVNMGRCAEQTARL